MLVKFIRSGESPDIGVFIAGGERGLPDTIARIYISRKLAVEVKTNKPAPAKVAKKEAKENGGE